MSIGPHIIIIVTSGLKVTPLDNSRYRDSVTVDPVESKVIRQVNYAIRWDVTSYLSLTFDKEACDMSPTLKITNNSGNLAKYCQKIRSSDCPTWMMSAG